MLEKEIVFVFQTVVLFVLFVSMAFRMKGNYRLHGITMIVAIAPLFVAGFMVLPDFMDPSFMEQYMSSSLTLVLFGLHAFFGFAAPVFGVLLVALWRLRSTDFSAKSKRIWQLTVICWVSAYVVGVLLHVALRTTFFA